MNKEIEGLKNLSENLKNRLEKIEQKKNFYDNGQHFIIDTGCISYN